MRLVLASLFLLSSVSAYPAPPGAEHATFLESAAAVKDSYDYVIVGGGTSGLTVADRLTADGKYTVLVIEHGALSSGTGMSSDRMYNITSEPQAGLNNRRFSVGIGHCVGGSSAVNGMVFLRGTAEEYDIWGELGGGAPTTWSWKEILPYFRRGIYFTPPEATFASVMNVTYDMNVWGQEPTTKIYATFTTRGSSSLKFMYNAMAAMPGVDIPKDGSAGTNGLFWYTASVDPVNYARSYARTGHYDGIRRDNYELVTGQRVNKILFDGTTATGVQFVPKTGGGAATTVKAVKEVILAAGAIHTPQVLQLSGIGPKPLLDRANIPVLVNLPGVGSNFQDHSYIPNIAYQWGTQPNPPPVNLPAGKGSNPNLGLFVGLPVIAPDSFERLAKKFESQDPAQYLPANTDPTVVAGYKLQQKLWARAMRSKGVTFLEQMMGGGPGGSVQNLHCASRGTVNINPSNPQGEPIVDYRAMSNPIDVDVMVEIVKFMRRFMTTGTLAQYRARETSPGPSVSTDEQLATWVRGSTIPSVFHPVGTTAKMPRELGGVLDENLLVWGTQKLSVIDASMMPTTVGATTSMTVYAVAEKAADIIKSRQ